MVSHGCALVAKFIEIEEPLGCDPTHEEPTEKETDCVQCITVDKQETAEFGLMSGKNLPLGRPKVLILIKGWVPLGI